MEDKAEKIFEILKTRERASDFLILSDILKSLEHYVGDIDFTKVLQEKFGHPIPNWFNDVLSVLPDLGKNLENRDEILNIVSLVQDMISESDTVKIEMPFEPSSDFLNKALTLLKEYFNVNGKTGKNILLDVEVKELSDAGALVYVDGKFIDLTLRNQVINYLSTEDVISRYL